jgi:hypothetical protein
MSDRNNEDFSQPRDSQLAAGVQDKAWSYIELFHHEQGREDTGYVTNAASAMAGRRSSADWTGGLSAAHDPGSAPC